MLIGVHQFPNAFFVLKFFEIVFEWMGFFQSSKFFTVVFIVAIANIITTENMYPLVIIGYQGYEFRITWEEANLATCTELFQHSPRVAEKIHENLSGRPISDSTRIWSTMVGLPSSVHCNRENLDKIWSSNFTALNLSVLIIENKYLIKYTKSKN
jgi:hypothetical protein